MPKINVLPKSIAELIAAGEVVERPASVVKEAVENSIDAGARHITVEIQRGGITFIRITDDGCGISREDVPIAFMRHATSKIRAADDLDAIATLGFRGEALAAAAAVSRVELFTKTESEPYGTHYKIEGGVEISNEETGCPEGTTLIIRDLFYNTPARMKFLKKDVSEGTAVAAVVEREALAHPEVSFKLIRDGKQTLSTSGDGKLQSAVYSVLGREFSKTLILVKGESGGIAVEGFVCRPVHCRASRAYQFTFLNGRYVHSGTVTAACEQAYKNSAMVGKFPAFVLNVMVPLGAVDVNVHPAKTEIRFSDERRIFEAVHYAVKNAILSGDTRPEIELNTPKNQTFMHMTAEQYRQTAVKLPDAQPKPAPTFSESQKTPVRLNEDNTPFFLRKEFIEAAKAREERKVFTTTPPAPRTQEVKPQAQASEEPQEYTPEKEIRLIGEAFSTYIIVEQGDSIYLIDKHAAHERILFNNLKKTQEIETQALLAPITVKLDGEEYTAVLSSLSLFEGAGFELEDFGNETILVRAIPAALSSQDVEAIVTNAAALVKRGETSLDVLDDIFHTVACKAAIKAGFITSREEQLHLAKKTLGDTDVMYCPHGRPVAFKIKHSELERHFGRIQ